MYVTMHCGGLPFNGDTLKTKSLGGSESAAYYLAKELVAKGHRVTLFTNSEETGTFDGVKYEWAGHASDDMPLGDRFTFYAEHTPHDLCIIQRHPRAFERKWASKQNFLWLHDLALLRSKEQMVGQLWNVDCVLCVSEYHRKQVHDVWGIPLNRIAVVHNGVDLDLYKKAEPAELAEGVRHLIYSSRPERGLLHLVRKGGIMERLVGEKVMLHVCGYDNTTPQMEGMYTALWQRCEELPNVINHGALTKTQLAELQLACDAWIYPTEFEEVSCITAMEIMSAGAGAVVSGCGALPETCADSGTLVIPLIDGAVDEDAFVTCIKGGPLRAGSTAWQRLKAQTYAWANSAEEVLEAAMRGFADAASPAGLAHHFMRHSDISALDELNLQADGSPFVDTLLRESALGYEFYRENTYAKHYAAYYEYEKDRGVDYGPEDVTRTARFQAIANMVSLLPAGSRVLDYGCAHGHYTVTLAGLFPTLTFIGADITQSNLDKAQKWADALKLTNISFLKVAGILDVPAELTAHFIIAAEVIEHVGNPQEYVDILSDHLTESGMLVVTTPYGPWEAQGYRQHGYWRAHLHHFERADIIEAFGHHPNFKICVAPSGVSQFYSALGSYIFSFTKPTERSREINYLRKTMQTMPDQTVSCCMIVKDAEADILRCLRSVLPVVQEFVIGVDATTSDNTKEIIARLAAKNPLVAFTILDITSPIEQGFAAARNQTIERASCDWVLWIDADEVLVDGGELARFTRNSMYNGFAVRQHHFSQSPAALIKTDLPCRLFRNRMGVKFFGLVHEHPEITMNDGVGPVMLLPRTAIIHNGYHDETVRRNRFGRNLPLLERDRKENPERLLGKFLWLRDLAQSCQYEMEANTMDDAVFLARAEEGIKLWEELLDAKNFRLVIDAMPYYSQLAAIKGGGIDFSFKVDASEVAQASTDKQPEIGGHFTSKAHALKLMNMLVEDRISTFGSKYL